MATLPTNFKDDILDTSVNTRRRYRVYENTDGTIELEDVTEYSQVGDAFGAGQINSTNTEVNKKFDKNMLVRDLDTINAITKEGYAPDALALKEVNQSLANGEISFSVVDGEPYVKVGADSPRPFKSSVDNAIEVSNYPGLNSDKYEATYTIENNGTYVAVANGQAYYYSDVKSGECHIYVNDVEVEYLINNKGYTYINYSVMNRQSISQSLNLKKGDVVKAVMKSPDGVVGGVALTLMY